MYIHEASMAKVAGYRPASVTGLLPSMVLQPPGAPQARMVAVTHSVACIQAVDVDNVVEMFVSSRSCSTQILSLVLVPLVVGVVGVGVVLVVVHKRETRPVA